MREIEILISKGEALSIRDVYIDYDFEGITFRLDVVFVLLY